MAWWDGVFNPDVQSFAKSREEKFYTTLTGVNNSGKSAYLKGVWARSVPDKTFYLPVSRFVSTLPVNETTHIGHINANDTFNSTNNVDQTPIDAARIVRRLTDDGRRKLFEAVSLFLNIKFEMVRENPANELSNAIFRADGIPFEATSTGTRLLFLILAAASQPNINCLLVDEPELGLSPNLQSIVGELFASEEKRKVAFPNLKSVVVATHSHLFLDRFDLSNNFVVEKRRNGAQLQIATQQIVTVQQFQAVQLRLLGNSLAGFFLPEAIVVVEGKTDFPYLKKIIEKAIPGRNISVVSSQGSPKDAVYRFSHALGGLTATPYAERLFVVFDSVHNKDQSAEVAKMGVRDKHIVKWDKNGIEYLYPTKIMEDLFKAKIPAGSLFDQDTIEINGVRKTKSELSLDVCGKIDATTEFPEEIARKLVAPLREVLGAK